jgi:hypothetical protein
VKTKKVVKKPTATKAVKKTPAKAKVWHLTACF